jgi:hypothetical protein
MTETIAVRMFTEREEAEQAARLLAYQKAYLYYLGEHKPQLAVRQGQPNDNVRLNLAKLIIDKGAAFLFGQEPEFQLDEAKTTPAEKYLAKVWERNRKMTLLSELAVSGGLYGHLFVKILNDGIAPGIPRLENVLPEYVTVVRDADDYRRVRAYIIAWTSADERGKPVDKRQEIVQVGENTWEIRNRVHVRGAWQPDPNAPDFTWPWPWPPMVDAPNLLLPGSFYGQSDLDDLAEQDAINYVASKVQRILRYHAHPKTIGKGFKNGDIQIDEDDMLILPSAESDLFNLEMQSDLGSSLAFLDKLITSYLATARIPRLDPAVVNVGALSGFALKVLYGDLLEKTEQKRRTYGDLLIELNRRLLEMGGHGAENYTTIHWQDPLPADEQAEMTRDGFELDNQLASRETVQLRRNLDPETERNRMQGEREAEETLGAQVIRGFMSGTGTGFRRPLAGTAPTTER